MSLDVYLKSKCGTCNKGDELYWANITHNLSAMAYEAGVYQHLWRPEELNLTTAKQLIEPLKLAITLMKSDPDRFKKHNAKNGWGDYTSFLSFVEKYLQACTANPEANIEVSR